MTCLQTILFNKSFKVITKSCCDKSIAHVKPMDVLIFTNVGIRPLLFFSPLISTLFKTLKETN